MGRWRRSLLGHGGSLFFSEQTRIIHRKGSSVFDNGALTTEMLLKPSSAAPTRHTARKARRTLAKAAPVAQASAAAVVQGAAACVLLVSSPGAAVDSAAVDDNPIAESTAAP